MSRLADTLQRTLDQLGLPAAHLERSADLPPMSVKNIYKGSHPRADRFEKLLSAIASLSHRVDLLIAYILDDTPASYAPDLEHLLRDQLYSLLRAKQTTPGASIVQEAVAIARPLSAASRARQVLAGMARRLDEGDTVLADWLADTGELLTVAHLPAEPSTPTPSTVADHLDAAAATFATQAPHPPPTHRAPAHTSPAPRQTDAGASTP